VDELDQIAARIRDRDRGGARGPWTLELYPTLLCNLSCRFCDTTLRHRPPINELSPDELLALVDEAADAGARRVTVLGGGEPLLAPGTPPLLRRIKARGLEGVLTTNGTLMGHEVRRLLVETAWDEVHVSLDGATAEVHDHLRGHRGAFRRTVAATCALRSLRGARGRPVIALHFVVTGPNVHQLSAAVRLAHALGADRVEFDALVAYRPEQHALALGRAALEALPSLVARAQDEARLLGVRTTLDRFASAPVRGTRPPAPGPGEGWSKAPCLKAWHSLVVAADGRISPCCVLAGEGESVRAVGLRAAWESSPYLAKLREAMRAGTPTGRCVECSENILAHERAIRARLADA
jgi:MoaA/NifB/PqqE/SkfB family radical SAM enzyme